MASKKKTSKINKAPIAGGVLYEVTAVFGPGQPIGASFEYKNGALHVIALSAKSAARDEGVKEAMIMTHVNKMDVLGMPQEQLLELLRKQTGTVRHIRFTSLAGSSVTADPDDTEELKAAADKLPVDVTKLTGFPNVLDAQGRIKRPTVPLGTPAATAVGAGGANTSQTMQITTSDSLGYKNNTTALSSNKSANRKGGVASDDWETALHIRPANTTVHSATTTQNATIAPAVPLPYAATSTLTVNHYLGAPGASLKGPVVGAKSALPAPVPATTPGVDPFSTPARRRRIVADVSRFLLKQYCLKACDQVLYRRRANAACLKIQCSWRMYWARRRLLRLRWRRQRLSANKIQRIARAFLARCELLRRRKARETAQRLRLALLVQRAWRAMKIRRRKARERAARIARREGKRHAAAVHVQRVTRGMIARNRSRQLREKRGRIWELKKRSAITIQCKIRQHIAYKTFLKLKCIYLKIAIAVLMWWRRRRWQRSAAARLLQRVARGAICRWRYRRKKRALDDARRAKLAAEERKKQELRFQQLLSQATAKAEEDASLWLTLRARVELRLLRHLAAMGPQETMLWAITSGLLSFQHGLGYSVGEAALQALSVVGVTFPKLRPDSSKGAGEGLHASDETPTALGISHVAEAQDGVPRVVYVTHWCCGDHSSEIPQGDESLPSRWSQVVGIPRRLNGNGIELSVAREQQCLQIIIQIRASRPAVRAITVDAISPITNSATAPVKFTPITTICIALEGCERGTEDEAPVIAPASDMSLRHADFVMKLIEFQGVRVAIPEPEPELPSPEPEPVPQPSKESVSVIESDNESEPEPHIEPREEESFGSMDDEIESLPDLDSPACIIQFAYRSHLRQRILAVMKIQRRWFRTKRLKCWLELVRTVWNRAARAIRIMQHCGLAFISRKRVEHLREQEFLRLLNDIEHVEEDITEGKAYFASFLKDEESNWTAFGLHKPDNIPQQVLNIAASEQQAIDVPQSSVRSVESAGKGHVISEHNMPTGILMFLSSKAPQPQQSVRASMIKAVTLPEAPTDCLHPLHEIIITPGPLGEPWNVFSDAELGVPLPDAALLTAPEDTPIPLLYSHVASKGFI